jgi:hypothetical protein
MSANVPFILESSEGLWNLNIENNGLSFNVNTLAQGRSILWLGGVWGQIGIGTTHPQGMLDVVSHVGGFGETIARFNNPNYDASIIIESGVGQESYLRFKNQDTKENSWMIGMDDDEQFKIAYGVDEEIRDSDTKFCVLQSGEVGIGTIQPTEKLQVEGNICASGSIGQCSDLRFKTDIQPLTDSLNQVLALSGRRYQWNQALFPEKAFNEKAQIGFVAQEVESICPEVVFTDSQGDKYLDYSRLTPVLVEAIKEQQQLIQQQQSLLALALQKINQLETKLGL